MKEKIEAFKTWIMGNKVIAGIGAAVLLFFIYKKFARKTYRRRRRALPRSVSITRRRRSYTSGGRTKKPWQIKGSQAARRHMAQIRKRR